MPHLAPKRYRWNTFAHIKIEDKHYCPNLNLVYDIEEQDILLHDGKPCVYTDNRHDDKYSGNFYSKCRIGKLRDRKSLKALIRKANSLKGLKGDELIRFESLMYIPGKNVDLAYRYRPKNTETDIVFKVDAPTLSNNFDTPLEASLVTQLREVGFLIFVYDTHPDFIYGKHDGMCCVGYGHGRRIGFSNTDTFRGYKSGDGNILWEYREDFNKWSRCNILPKTSKKLIETLTK